MSTNTFDEVRENLEAAILAGSRLVPEDLSMKFVKEQGPASTEGGAEGRTFSVSGPKADKVRALIFAQLGLTRRQIADLVNCSVSRVSEVVWGLKHDGVEFPEIPLRAEKPAAEPKPGMTPEDDNRILSDEELAEMEAFIAANKARKEAARFAEQMAATNVEQPTEEPASDDQADA